MLLKKQNIGNIGMVQDMSISKLPENFAYKNFNISVQVKENGTILSISNIRKPERVKNISILGNIIGICDCNDYLVIFTYIHSEEHHIYRINIDKTSDGTIICNRLFRGNLNIDYNRTIDCVYEYESEHIQKVYWCDGYSLDNLKYNNFPRVINIITKGERENGSFTPYTNNDVNSFSFFPNVSIFPKINVIKKNSDVLSKFPAGVIQYYFTYINKNGAETLFVGNSDLITLDNYLYGSTADTSSIVSLEINISNIDTNFDFIRIYSVYRTTLDGELVCSIVKDLEIKYGINHISFIDNGTLNESISPEEFYNIGGTPLYAKTIEKKIDLLFLGNVKTQDVTVSDGLKSIIDGMHSVNENDPDKINTCIWIVEDKKKIFEDGYNENDGLFYYRSQCEVTEKRKRTFKRGEIYRFAIQFQYATGYWTEAYWIGDKRCTGNNEINSVNSFTFNIPEDKRIFFREACIKNGISNYRILIADAENSNGRSILTQGVLCPTMFNLYERNNKTCHAFPSWVMRLRGGNIANHHYEPISFAECGDGEISSFASYLGLKENERFYPTVTMLSNNSKQIGQHKSCYHILHYCYAHEASKSMRWNQDTYGSLAISAIYTNLKDDYYYYQDNGFHLKGGDIIRFSAFKDSEHLYDGNSGFLNTLKEYGAYNEYTPGKDTHTLLQNERSQQQANLLTADVYFQYLYYLVVFMQNEGQGLDNVFYDTIIQGQSTIQALNMFRVSAYFSSLYFSTKTTSNYDTFFENIYNVFSKWGTDKDKAKRFLEFFKMGWVPVPHRVAPKVWGYEGSDLGCYTFMFPKRIDGIDEMQRISVEYLPNDGVEYCYKIPDDQGREEIGPIGFMSFLHVTDYSNDNLKIGDADFFKNSYFIDESIVTLNSQEIINNPTLFDNKNLKLRINGIATFSSSNHQIQVENETPSWSVKNNLLDSNVSEEDANTFVGDYIYADSAWIKKQNKIEPSEIDYYKLFLWHNGGSLIGADENTTNKDDYKGAVPSVLKSKTFYNFRFSKNTQYLSWSKDIIYNSLYLKCVDNCDTLQDNYFYKPNYENLLLTKYSPTLHKNDGIAVWYPFNGEGDGENMPIHKTSVHIKFSSTPHVVISFDDIQGYIKHILPALSPGEQYLGALSGKYVNNSKWNPQNQAEDFEKANNGVNGHLKWIEKDLKNPNVMIYNFDEVGQDYSTGAFFLSVCNKYNIRNFNFISKQEESNRYYKVKVLNENDIDNAWDRLKTIFGYYCLCAFIGEHNYENKSYKGTYTRLAGLDDATSKARVEMYNQLLRRGEMYLYCQGAVSTPCSEYKNGYIGVYVRIHLKDNTSIKDIYEIDDVEIDEVELKKISLNESRYLWGQGAYILGFHQFSDDNTDAYDYDYKFFNTYFDQSYQQPLIDDNKINASNPYLFIGELYQDINYSDLYGGTSEQALSKLIWLPASDITSIKDDVKEMYGDTFFQRWECLKTYPTTEEDINKVVDITSIMLESHINLDERTDRNKNALNIMSRPQNFNQFNDVYNQKDNIITQIIPNTIDKSTVFKSAFVTSQHKNKNGLIDNYTNISSTSLFFLDFPITKLVLNKNYLSAFCDKSIYLIKYHEDTLINTNDGAIQMGQKNDDIDSKIISSNNGTTNSSVLITEKGLYFIDTMNFAFMRIDKDGIKNLSQGKLEMFCKDNIINGTYHPTQNQNAFFLTYDIYNKDIYISNLSYCIVYNEMLESFTSFIDLNGLTRKLFYIGNKRYALAYANSSNGIYDMSSGNEYNRGYDKELVDYYLHYRFAGYPITDKVFTNVEFIGDLGVQRENRSKTLMCPFNYIHVWNEHQDTGECQIKLERNKISEIKQKFRTWRINIPRDQNHILNRIRNPWIHLELGYKQDKNNPNDSQMEIHNIDIQYME